MGNLTNQYVSQSFQGLLKLDNSATGVTATLQYVQDGLGNNIPMQVSTSSVAITGSLFGTASYATQALSASYAPDTTNTGSLVSTSSFNAYTSSNDSKVNSLIAATGSFVTEAESGSFMITGSVAGDTLTFTKGNGSQFNLQVNTGSLPSGVISGSQQITNLGFATTSSVNQKLDTGSFNTYTSSNDSKVNSLIASTGSYATTSSVTSLSQSIAVTDLAQNNRLNSIEGVTGSFATTSSLNSYTLTSSFNSYTSSTNGRLNSLESATGSLQNQINQKLDTGSFNSYTSSNDGKVNSLIAATASYVTETESGSFMITGSASGNVLTFTKGNGTTFNLSVDTGSNSNRNGLITTGSVAGNQSITGSLNVQGTISATSASFTYLETVFETASVIYSSGSNQFGDASNDTQTLFGTVVLPNGPLVITGSVTASAGFVGNLTGTASYATNALSASHAVNADTAISSSQAANAVSSSYANNATSASYSNNSTSASFAQNAISSSHSLNADNSISSSQAQNAVSASQSTNSNTSVSSSFAQTAISSSQATNAISASQAQNANTASYVLNAVSSSYSNFAVSASQAQNAVSASYAPDTTNTGSLVVSVLRGPVTFEDEVTVTKGDGTTNTFTINNVVQSDSSSYSNFAVSSSQAQDAVSSSFATNAGSASYAPTVIPNWVATTGSNVFVGAQTINNDLTIASTNPFGTFVNMVSTGTTSFNLDSPLTQFQSNGLISFTNTLSSTGSSDITFLAQNGGDITFNTSNSGSVAITGSVNISGSVVDIKAPIVRITGSLILSGSAGVELDVKGDQTITGSLSISGSQSITRDLRLFSSASYGNVVPGLYITASSPVSQSNIIFATIAGADGQGPLTANQTGSIIISGSNNILFASNRISSSTAIGFIGGSGNIVGTIPTLNPTSLILPSIANNQLQSAVQFNFTTSSLSPATFTNNLVYNAVNINSQSGSIAFGNNLVILGPTINAQTTTLGLQTSVSSNALVGTSLTLNQNSSSILYTQNIGGLTITNNYSSSVSTAVNNITVSQNLFNGSTLTLVVSGSNTANRRTFNSNLITGRSNEINSNQSGSSAGHLVATALLGQNLIVSASNTSTTSGGTVIVGRFNATGSLQESAQDTVFVVGSGASAGARRNSLKIDSSGNTELTGSVGVTGSFKSIGDVQITGSLNVSGSSNFIGGDVNISGSSLKTNNFVTFNGSPNEAGAMSNFVALQMNTRDIFGFTNILQSELSSGSNFNLSTQGGSNYSDINFKAAYGGTEAIFKIANSNGTRNVDVKTDTMTVTGSFAVTGNVLFASGSNKTMGTFVLDGANPGAATISNSLVTATSLIFLTKQTNVHSGNGTVSVTSKGSGTFSVTSNHNGDTDTVAYLIINPS